MLDVGCFLIYTKDQTSSIKHPASGIDHQTKE